eukprot:scaffold48955_cov36-Phaeocystis_antarctica.AAC.1
MTDSPSPHPPLPPGGDGHGVDALRPGVPEHDGAARPGHGREGAGRHEERRQGADAGTPTPDPHHHPDPNL